MVPRRRFLLTLAALFATGCTARTTRESTTSSPSTPVPTATPTAPPSPALTCSETTPVDPPRASGTGEVTPPPYPALPTSLDADAASSFVSEYETAYVVNRLVMDAPGATYVDAAVGDAPPVTETERGYVVDLEYTYAVEAATPADYPPRHVAYLVRAGVVARAELDPDEDAVPFPLADATVLRCEP